MRVFLGLALALAVVGVVADDAAEDEFPSLTPAELEAELSANEKVLVMFYAPWCGHCKRLKPDFNKLQAANADAENKAVARMDCTVAEHKDVCKGYGVRGYPTLILFENGEPRDPYRGDRSQGALQRFLDNPEEALKAADAAPKKNAAKAPTGEPDPDASTAEQLNAAIESGDKVFVKFFAPWCGHCKKLAPTWHELMEQHKETEGTQVLKVDCTRETEVCKTHGVRGYPTLILFENGEKHESGPYRGGRDKTSLNNYLSDPSKPVAAPTPKDRKPEGPPDADASTADQLRAAIATGDDVFVKFFAPWCGHCKKLAPTWHELMEENKAKQGTQVLKVDCTREGEICKTYGVRGYPTLIMFENGEKVEEPYRGGRDKAALQSYIDAAAENNGAASEEL